MKNLLILLLDYKKWYNSLIYKYINISLMN
jgi:hypothetical protein